MDVVANVQGSECQKLPHNGQKISGKPPQESVDLHSGLTPSHLDPWRPHLALPEVFIDFMTPPQRGWTHHPSNFSARNFTAEHHALSLVYPIDPHCCPILQFGTATAADGRAEGGFMKSGQRWSPGTKQCQLENHIVL